MRFLYILIYTILITTIIGCADRPVFSKKIEVDGTWSYDNKLSFPFEIDNVDLTYDLILSLTYGTGFGYQNLYVKITTEYPNGKLDEDVLSLNLTNGSGIFLGDCNASKCEIDLLLQEKFKFSETGNYVITIYQHGRTERLEDVYAAELKLYSLK